MRWVVSALGKDRPGIVAGVTKVLFDLGCNLEDSAMSRLEGEFTIMLIFSSPKSVKQSALETGFAPVARKLDLTVLLKPLSSQETRQPADKPRYVISLYGADHPGIVSALAQSLAKSKINITDLSTHRTPGAGKRQKSLYLLFVAVELPSGMKAAALQKQLTRLAKKLGVEVSLRSDDAQVL